MKHGSACFPSTHNLSVFFSPALVLAGAATGAAETVTGTLSFCYLLFIWKCLFLPVCGDWLSIAQSVRLCIFTWMAARVGVFLWGRRSETFYFYFFSFCQFVYRPFGCCFSCLGIVNCLHSPGSLSLHLRLITKPLTIRSCLFISN